MSIEQKKVPLEETEGGITSSYAQDDGVQLKVPYSFFGSYYDDQELNALQEVMKQDTMTMGPQVAAFQKEFAARCGVKYAFAVSNCTTAMHLCTQLLDIKKGDEVIVTPNTFVATSLVILKEGATPVYADIDPRTFNIDPEEIKKKVTGKTRAIYVVHYGGQVCDMDPIMEIAKRHGLDVLEDCAHSPMAEYKGHMAGSIGDLGCFSFHSLKNMNTAGEGGMVTTSRPEWEKPIEGLRCMNMFLSEWNPDQNDWRFGEHKIEKKKGDYWLPSHFDIDDYKGHWGNNYRMNEFQAAVGRVQLQKLDKNNEKRREIGRAISEGIKGLKGITPVYEDPDCKHVYDLYTVCIEEKDLGTGRDQFLRVLYREEGIQGILHYQPSYHFTGFKKLGLDNPGNHCPKAEEFFYKREFNLPIHPRLTEKDVDTMIQGIRNTHKKLYR